jgi:hypothetical protein
MVTIKAHDDDAMIRAQHAGLERSISRCEELANDFEAGLGDPAVLVTEVARLRTLFDEHNRFEERVLRARSAAIGRTIDGHVYEHQAMRDRLTFGVIDELRVTLAMLRDHLDAEHTLFGAD